jgi:hypothetical protein
VPVLAGLDHLTADFETHFVDHAQDVALGNRSFRPHDEIRAGQGIKVGCMIGDVKGAVQQLTQLLRGGWDIDVINSISCFRGCHVMGFRAHPADAVGQDRHLFHRSPNTELFEAA